jgi:RimJ/RimL family protein N-acetyltransferase
MIDLAGQTGVTRLEAVCHAQHRASARVLEKCGFTLKGLLQQHLTFPNLEPGKLSDVLQYTRVF